MSKDELACLNKKYNSTLFKASFEVVFVYPDNDTAHGSYNYAKSCEGREHKTEQDDWGAYVWAAPVFEKQIQCLELKVKAEEEIVHNGLKYRLVEGQ